MPTRQSLAGVPETVAEVAGQDLAGRRVFGLRDLSTLLPAALLLGSLLLTATLWGAGHRELLAASLVVILTQAMPGMVIWRFIRPRAGWWVEDIALGLPIGAALAVLSQVISVSISVTWLAAVISPAVGISLLAVPSSRARVLSAQCGRLPWLWGLLVAASCILPAVNAVKAFREPVRWSGWATPYVDLPYHLALSGELAHRFPPHYPQVAGEALYYHWFSHAWIAQVSNVSGTPLDVVLLRFMPALLAVAIPLATAVVAMRIGRLVWAGPLAAAIAFAIVQFDVWGFAGLSLPMAAPNSPTQGFGLLMLLPTIALLALRWRGEAGRGSFVVLLLLLVIAGGSKGSMLPVLVAGALVGSVMYVVHRSAQMRRILLDTVTAAVVLVLLARFLFGGGVGGTRLALFDPLVAVRGESFLGPDADITGLTLVSFLILAMLPIFLGAIAGLWVLLGRETCRDPIGWLLAGSALSGAGAIMILDHPGLGQYYFLYTAEAPLSILAGWGFALVLARMGRPVPVAAVGAATAVLGVAITRLVPGPIAESTTRHLTAWVALLVFGALAVVLAVAAAFVIDPSGTGRRNAAVGVLVGALTFAGLVPMVEGVAEPLPAAKFGVEREPGAVHSTEVRAARWIRDHSKPADIVMTNRHCRVGRGATCDHRRFYVAAYSERGVLLEGWAYTKKANALAAEGPGVSGSKVSFWDPELLALNDRFLVEPSSTDAQRLYHLGVRWVYLHRGARHADTLAPFAVERFRVGAVRVYELLDPTAE